MSSDFTTVLDECLDRIKAGESISVCLERYPEHAGDLKPLLEAVQFVEALRFTEPPRPQVLARGRQRFLTEAARLREQQQITERSFFEKLRDFFLVGGVGPAWSRVAATIVVVLLLFGTLSGVVVQASESSLPGDPLYSVKQVTRQFQLLTTFNLEAREEKREQIQAEERKEVRQATQQGRVFEKDVAGIIIELQGNVLVLEDGLHIRLTDATQIEGQLKAGHIAEVHVRSEDGRLLAEQIEVRKQSPPGGAATGTPTVVPTPTPEPTQTPWPTYTPEPPKPPPTKVIPTDTPKPKVTDTPPPTVTERPPEKGPHIFEIRGPIDSISESMWIVAGQEVQVTSSTIIKGEPAVGRIAYVQANRLRDGSFVAVEIEIETPAATPTPRKVYFSGVVDSKESETVWFISGQRTRLDDRTEINGELKVGAFVDVEGLQESPTTVFAQKITVVRACENLVPLEGVIQSINVEAGIWVVGAFTIDVGSGVPILGVPTIGAIAQVDACQLPDGSFSAQRIFIVPTPTPTYTPITMPTATLTLTPTVESGVTPTLSPEPRETPTLTPTMGVSSDLTPTTEPSPAVTSSPPGDVTPTVSPSPGTQETPTLTPTTEPSPAVTSSPPGDVTPTVSPTSGIHETYTPTSTVSVDLDSTPTSTIEPSPSATSPPPNDATPMPTS